MSMPPSIRTGLGGSQLIGVPGVVGTKGGASMLMGAVTFWIAIDKVPGLTIEATNPRK